MKSNTVQPETFVAANFGKVGTIFNNKVTYESTSLRPHTYQTPFDVSKIEKLPKVGIVYNHGGVEGIQAQALVDAGYAGIVNAGVGHGNIHKSIFPILEKAAKSGIAVVPPAFRRAPPPRMQKLTTPSMASCPPARSTRRRLAFCCSWV